MVRGLREGIGSIASVAGVLAALVSMDPRVRTRVADLVQHPAEGGATAGARLGELAETLWRATRDQAAENALLLAFAIVAAALVLFMLRT